LRRRAPIRNDHDQAAVVLPSDPRPLPTVSQYDDLLTSQVSSRTKAV
jgi:hypothetical protein